MDELGRLVKGHQPPPQSSYAYRISREQRLGTMAVGWGWRILGEGSSPPRGGHTVAYATEKEPLVVWLPAEGKRLGPLEGNWMS